MCVGFEDDVVTLILAIGRCGALRQLSLGRNFDLKSRLGSAFSFPGVLSEVTSQQDALEDTLPEHQRWPSLIISSWSTDNKNNTAGPTVTVPMVDFCEHVLVLHLLLLVEWLETSHSKRLRWWDRSSGIRHMVLVPSPYMFRFTLLWWTHEELFLHSNWRNNPRGVLQAVDHGHGPLWMTFSPWRWRQRAQGQRMRRHQ